MTWLPRHLSHSAIELYARCPAAYRRRYIERQPDPPTPAMLFGRVFHETLEAVHQGEDGDVSWVKAYTAAGLPGTGAPSLQHGLALLAAYQAHGIGAGASEQRFEFYLPDRDSVPVPINGVIDLATDTDVWEFKTSAAKWDQGKVDGSPQAALYRWAYIQLYGRKPACVRFLVFHTRRVSLEEFCAYPAGPELRLFELAAAATYRGIRDGVFPARCKAPWCLACVDVGLVKPRPDPVALEVGW